MGSDHSTLALTHNVDELEHAVKHKKLARDLVASHSWSSKGISSNIKILDNGRKVTYHSSDTKLAAVRSQKGYEFGIHFFALKWKKTPSSQHISLGLSTQEMQLESDGELLLGCDDQSVGWNPITKLIMYNSCTIKTYPDKKLPTYTVPENIIMVLNMDQGSLMFRVDGESLGVAMSGLKHVANKLYIAACVGCKGEEIKIEYLGGSDTLESFHEVEIEPKYITSEQLKFHNKCGINIKLTDSNLKASRIKPRKNFNGATAVTQRPLNDGETFELHIEEMDDSSTWVGCLIIGVTTTNPEKINFPADCMTEYSGGDTWSIRQDKVKHNEKDIHKISTDLDELKVGDTIILKKDGNSLLVTVKNKTDKIKINQAETDLYGFVDVYGQTTRVLLIPGKPSTSSKQRAKQMKPTLLSLDQLFHTMEKQESKDIHVITKTLQTITGSSLEKNRTKRRLAGDELSKNERPRVLKNYVKFLIQQNKSHKKQESMECLKCLLHAIISYANCSMLFCKKLGSVGILEVLMTVLKDDNVGKDDVPLTEMILKILYNCSQATENKKLFRDIEYVTHVKPYRDADTYDKKMVTMVYLTMSYVYKQNEVSLLKLPDNIVVFIVDCLEKCIKAKDNMCEGWHVRELVLAITNFTVYDSNIYVFIDNNVIDQLMKVLNLSAIYDQECALNAIWSLITDATKFSVRETENFVERLELMRECGHPTVEQAVERILSKVKVQGQFMPVSEKTANCKYKKLCERFKTNMELSDAFFDHDYDICYCSSCHADRGDKSYYTRGIPPKDFGIPVGWCRFGLRPPPKANALRAFAKWHRSFHGTRKEAVDSILKVGDLAPAGRSVLGGGTLKELPGHFSDEGFKPEGFNTKRIFLSPSIRYSGIDTYATPSRFKDPLTGKTHNAKVAFLVLVAPDSYQVGAETIGADHEIDPGFSNQEMEWIVEEQGSTILYGLLVKVD